MHIEERSIFPLLETERLLLRGIRTSDLEDIYALYRDPEVMQYRGADTCASAQEAVELLEQFRNLWPLGEGIRWALTQKEGNERLVGTAGLKKIDRRHYRGEIGYELSPLLWNKGIMTEALASITAFSFNVVGLHTLEANIAPANIASERVLQKLNFVKEAHYKENWYYQGWWDSVIYTLHNPRQSKSSEMTR